MKNIAFMSAITLLISIFTTPLMIENAHAAERLYLADASNGKSDKGKGAKHNKAKHDDDDMGEMKQHKREDKDEDSDDDHQEHDRDHDSDDDDSGDSKTKMDKGKDAKGKGHEKNQEMMQRRDERKQIMEESKADMEGAEHQGKKSWWKFWGESEK